MLYCDYCGFDGYIVTVRFGKHRCEMCRVARDEHDERVVKKQAIEKACDEAWEKTMERK